MPQWLFANTLVLRNIACSDGTVTTAIPAFCLEDSDQWLLTFIPKGTAFKNNYVVPSSQRVAMVTKTVDSAQRQYKELNWWYDTIRIYLPDEYFSISIFYDEQGQLMSYYANLEAPFLKIPIGIDTRDYALDVIADAKGKWQWKDEAEFEARLDAGIDSKKHQSRVRQAGLTFIDRLEFKKFPLNRDWQCLPTALSNSLPKGLPQLPITWDKDFGSHELLTRQSN